MNLTKYILDGKTPVPTDLYTWAEWIENNENNRSVAKTDIGEARVSTVFLGLDHQFGNGPPLLFETMAFGGELDGEQQRYSTWEEAEAGHAEMVRRVRETT